MNTLAKSIHKRSYKADYKALKKQPGHRNKKGRVS